MRAQSYLSAQCLSTGTLPAAVMQEHGAAPLRQRCFPDADADRAPMLGTPSAGMLVMRSAKKLWDLGF